MMLCLQRTMEATRSRQSSSTTKSSLTHIKETSKAWLLADDTRPPQRTATEDDVVDEETLIMVSATIIAIGIQ